MKKRCIAILTSCMMLASAAASMPVAEAEQISETQVHEADLPEWIPNDFESALEFRNTFGKTRVLDGLICIVFEQEDDSNTDSERLRYNLMTTEGALRTLQDEVYSAENLQLKLEVVVYQPEKQGEIEVAIIDTWAKGESLDIGYLHAINHFTFSMEGEEDLRQTDIYSWLPDSESEFGRYINDHNEVSVRDNYVVFCLTQSAGTPYQWNVASMAKDDFEYAALGNCTPVCANPIDGGAINSVHVFKACKDGHCKLSYELRSTTTDEEPLKTMTADCEVLDGAATILLPREVRVKLVDADTGELLVWDETHWPSLWTNASFGSESTGPIVELIHNPQLVPDLSSLSGADSFSFGLREYNLPEGYVLPSEYPEPGYYSGTILPENHMTMTKYENGATDIAFRLKYASGGDISGDGVFDVSDAVLMQKWLYGDPEAVLEKWQAGDLFRNNRIDAVDFTMMKRRLLAEMVEVVQPEKWFTAQNAFCISGDDYNIYTGPGDEYAVIQTVKPFEWFNEIGVMENNDDWVYASCSGVYGWVRVVGKDGRPNLTPVGKMIDKPVIYLYPEQETDVHVTLELTESKLSTTYPRYNDGWDVTAYPDGTLLNKADGTHHKYLFWDSTESRTKFDFSRGFCVAGSDTEQFLKEKLTYMGLTEDEMNEFIVYWLPRMEHNAYNLIAFQGDVYTDSAKLNITPAPDSLCRVFMAYIPLDEAAEIEPQQLETFERKGFSVVEWGGTEIGARH